MIALSEVLETIAHAPIEKRAMTNLGVLNEAYAYAKPSSFARGMRIDLGEITILLISGTASIDENGQSVHIGDFRASCGGHTRTLRVCWRARAVHGTTSCGRHVISAISIAITKSSTRSARSSSWSKDSIHCRLRQASRRICAGRNC